MLLEKMKLWLFLNLFLCPTLIQAQVTVPATGNNFTGNGGTVNFSIGQIVYIANNGMNGYLIQGVQQPFEITVITCIEKAKEIDLIYSVFPNPTTEYITLKTKNYKIAKLNYQLFDLKGNLLEARKIDNVETNINMTKYICATYILKIIEENKKVKIFKLIKR